MTSSETGYRDVDELVIPDRLWKSESTEYQLCLVGRLLARRAVNFEGMCASLRIFILPVKGMGIKQLPVDRLLIRFNHVIDRNRTLEGCPWSFEKNVLVLSGIGENENPMQYELDFQDPDNDIPYWPLLRAPIPSKSHPRNVSRYNNDRQSAT
ncbi:UNVERIFIED_CONTAM: hypothetical protein Slati_3804400 [Sesamum latifolium]|uniref:DUF4283 domain-containing protein n=1 Tax=Sesamum latifolium TaxID=2727402 RepID=A0AAW2U652_9LAMI